MGIYVFTWKKLREYLIEDESDEASSNDFGKNIIPKMLADGQRMYAYQFDGPYDEAKGHRFDKNAILLLKFFKMELSDEDIYHLLLTCLYSHITNNGKVNHYSLLCFIITNII